MTCGGLRPPGSYCWPPTGCRIAEIARRVGVSRPTVVGSWQRYTEAGIGGLAEDGGSAAIEAVEIEGLADARPTDEVRSALAGAT